MLRSMIIVSLIVSINIPRFQGRIALVALTVQQNNTYNTGVNNGSIYGSVTQEKTEVYESPDSFRPSSTQTRTVIASGGPGHEGITYARSEDRNLQGESNQTQSPDNGGLLIIGSQTFQRGNTYNEQPGSHNVYGSHTEQINRVYKLGGETQPNDIQVPSNGGEIRYRSYSVQANNVFNTSSGSTNVFRSITVQEGNTYNFKSQTPNNGPNNTTNSAQNNDNATSQAHSAEHGKPNSDIYYLFLYIWIGLFKYILF